MATRYDIKGHARITAEFTHGAGFTKHYAFTGHEAAFKSMTGVSGIATILTAKNGKAVLRLATALRAITPDGWYVSTLVSGEYGAPATEVGLHTQCFGGLSAETVRKLLALVEAE